MGLSDLEESTHSLPRTVLTLCQKSSRLGHSNCKIALTSEVLKRFVGRSDRSVNIVVRMCGAEKCGFEL